MSLTPGFEESSAPFGALLELQDRMSRAFQTRSGILWRLEQIPERAKAREGDEREKLLRRAEVLEQELRPAIVESERLRSEATRLEIELRMDQIGAFVQNAEPRAQALYRQYADAMAAVPHVEHDLEALADAMIEVIRLERNHYLEDRQEVSPELAAARERVGNDLIQLEQERQQRVAVAMDYEPRIRKSIEIGKPRKKR